MTREILITELKRRGYRVEAQDTVKNGVVLEGIKILTYTNVATIIYIKDMIKNAESKNKSLDDVVVDIIRIFEKSIALKVDLNSFFEKNYVLNHIFVGLQKLSTEDIVKKSCEEYEGIESYLYIRKEDGSGFYSLKVEKRILDYVDITEEEAWKKALENTCAETVIVSMAEILGFECSEEMDEREPFFVISNKLETMGASAVLNKKALSEFGKKCHTDKLIVLPSSVHEMLLIPYTEGIDIRDFSDLVKEVNFYHIDPIEQLAERAFIITV